jgi:RNA polymerase sigma factor (sigma-70 family)
LIEQDLTKVAHSWIRSNIGPDVKSLAMNMFTDVVEVLPNLRIDPTKNVRSYLISVARHRLIDTWRREFKPPRRPAKDSAFDLELHPGAPEARMWQDRFSSIEASSLADPHGGIIDPNTSDAEERVLTRIDNEQILRAIRDHWPKSLSRDDYRIVHLRYLADPQASFREIAQDLGGGWTEDAVRQRHFRVIKATRKYLNEQGLL